MTDAATAFLRESRTLLRDRYLPWILRCLDELPESDLWWRPNDASNAVGNLVLHLCGNARQWIVSGVGGQPDVRDRQGEFRARGGTADELRKRLEEVFGRVDDVLERLDEATLSEARRIQGRDVTVLEAVYHVVEHVSMHTGQVVWITKSRTGRELGFYRIRGGGTAQEAW